jgi:hypothetical protein
LWYSIISIFLGSNLNLNRIFEALIQVIATLLGFSIVAIFYYLGEVDDLKSRYINSLFVGIRSVKDVLDQDNGKKIPAQVKEQVSNMSSEMRESTKAQIKT